ncbi:gamma-glutamylcyclotransferase [Candidatus Uhrbacteria bacterium]|nr:gamma-glutamylcyclotransferase [Candidatus Uhrbacteria bacterium]MBD3284318.1 gamma-glutamylcyclotransferase [Candidatus Uhrbacteria bacterium]
MTMTHALIGYGSLIHPDSRAKTGITGSGTPIWVEGYQRSWNARDPERGFTVLGVTPNRRSRLNSVLFELPEEEIPKFDEREFGYHRVHVSDDVVSSYGSESIPEIDRIWMYVIDQEQPADDVYPLIQSYIDVCITGALNHGERFATDLIDTTVGWGLPLKNDRDDPLYPLTLECKSYWHWIDEGLKPKRH